MTRRLFVATEHHFLRAPDGSFHSRTGGREYAFWARYLVAFDEVVVVARVRDGAHAGDARTRADGPRVRFEPLPDFVGPAQFARALWPVRSILRRVSRGDGAFLLRVPGTIGTELARALRSAHRPFGVEVVGDPLESLAPGGAASPLRRVIAWKSARDLRRQCREAAVSCYVTQRALQSRYPPSAQAPTFAISDVELPAERLAASPRPPRSDKPFRLVTVGSLAQMYKAPDVLLDALRGCNDAGLSIHATWVGGGTYLDAMRTHATALGLAGRVEFVGQLPAGAAIFEQLDAADLFVLPSRTEGLPRALIEAMARALPCVATRVGGVPELLPEEDLVEPGDAAALAGKLQEVLLAPERLERMSRRNLERARDFSAPVLARAREAFFTALRERSASARS